MALELMPHLSKIESLVHRSPRTRIRFHEKTRFRRALRAVSHRIWMRRVANSHRLPPRRPPFRRPLPRRIFLLPLFQLRPIFLLPLFPPQRMFQPKPQQRPSPQPRTATRRTPAPLPPYRIPKFSNSKPTPRFCRTANRPCFHTSILTRAQSSNTTTNSTCSLMASMAGPRPFWSGLRHRTMD